MMISFAPSICVQPFKIGGKSLLKEFFSIQSFENVGSRYDFDWSVRSPPPQFVGHGLLNALLLFVLIVHVKVHVVIVPVDRPQKMIWNFFEISGILSLNKDVLVVFMVVFLLVFFVQVSVFGQSSVDYVVDFVVDNQLN
jgi:hypothetical protein